MQVLESQGLECSLQELGTQVKISTDQMRLVFGAPFASMPSSNPASNDEGNRNGYQCSENFRSRSIGRLQVPQRPASAFPIGNGH